ncbi:MAG: hypothetical protein EPN91_01320 [Salinibacterium sp.]|nr:MAG: hypothetical protein EPN91_01320 [Salinibacterium sp.]
MSRSTQTCKLCRTEIHVLATSCICCGGQIKEFSNLRLIGSLGLFLLYIESVGLKSGPSLWAAMAITVVAGAVVALKMPTSRLWVKAER